MKLSDFDYHLPKKLIAQQPVKPRDHSRLLVMKKGKNLAHKHFYDLLEFLEKGDVLVLNNTKVFPARLIGRKKETNGKVEVFLHKNLAPSFPLFTRKRAEVWQCIIGGKNIVEELEIMFKNKLECKIKKNNNDGTWDVEFNKSDSEFMKIVEKIGLTPLPPYIKSSYAKASEDRINYQTVYADDEKLGSVAAPTAGLHFTSALIKKLKNKGVKFEYITLHVGLGTFAPVKVNNIENHKMHAEWVEVKKSVLENINKAKKNNKKIIAVGTTSVRTLEAVFFNASPRMTDYSGWVNIFIYPGYKFKVIDGMITNFHLPKSTLLMLISALASRERVLEAYKKAVNKKYRFYSYGDAMLLL